MSSNVDIAVGLDLHKRFIVATILWSDDTSMVQRFERTKDGLLALKGSFFTDVKWSPVSQQAIIGFRFLIC